MKNISDYHKHCCGCGECITVCPKHAITMRQNKHGFLYPDVNPHLCVQCGLCLKHCAFNKFQNVAVCTPKTSFAVKHTEETVRRESRSGGVFTALSDWILEQNGVVYGCKLFNNTIARHCRATTAKERDEFRGSKYIQSNTQSVFDAVKEDLKCGRWVLFSGTACQVAAISEYCKNMDCNRLVLVDVVCHGVPSPKVWRDYLRYMEKKVKANVIAVDFRDKKRFGWAEHMETFQFDDGSICSDMVFRKLFYDHYILRPSCFECPYKSLNRVSDITIADCWGIRTHYPDFDDNKGVSLVLVNSPKGQYIYDELRNIEQISVDLEKLMQPCLKENWPKPVDYDDFWEFYHRHSFNKVIKKYVLHQPEWYKSVGHFLRRAIRKVYRIMLGVFGGRG